MAQALSGVTGARNDAGPDIDRIVTEHLAHFLFAKRLARTVGSSINRVGLVGRVIHHGIRRSELIILEF